jgi:hypothetical protein
MCETAPKADTSGDAQPRMSAFRVIPRMSWVMNADGGNLVQATDDALRRVPSFQGIHGFPSWSQGRDAVP